MTAAATLQSTGNQAKSQPNCDVVKIAEECVRTHLPFIQISNRRWSSSVDSNIWIARLELPDGQTLLLTFLCEGQQATVLQLPAKPTSEAEARAQERAVFAG